jgi:uncharacterized membrane protein
LNIYDLVITALLSLLPISELRGSIPYAVLKNVNPFFAYFYCVFFNCLAAHVVYIFLSTIHKFLVRFKWYKYYFEKFIIRARNKVKNGIDKYGYLGIMLFVALPLPVTGAYTATIGAWVLGMEKRKTFFAVYAGVAIAGIIVSLVVFFGIKTFSFFIKQSV